MPNDDGRETCRIEAALGHREPCPREACVLWNRGVVARQRGCLFDRVDLAGRTDLAHWLHDLRADLDAPAAP